MNSTLNRSPKTKGKEGASAQDFAMRHLRWNFIVNTIDAASYFFAFSFISIQVVLPVFVDKLTESPLLVGAVGAVYSIGFFVPQLLVANYAESLSRQKPFIIWMGFGIRLPILLMALACFVFNGAWLAAIFFLCFATFSLSLGATMPSYMNMFSKVFPLQTRGTFMGVSTGIGNALGALGGILVGLLLQNGSFPTNFGLIFLISFGFFAVSLIGFAFNREPVENKPPLELEFTQDSSLTPTRNGFSHNTPQGGAGVRGSKPSYSFFGYFRQLPAILRGNNNYRNFVIARAAFVAVSACAGLLAAYGVARFNLDASAAGGFTISFMIANSLASFVGGTIGDRYGHKLSLVLACVAMLLALVIALLAPSENWLYVSYFLYGLFVGAYTVSYQTIVLEFAPENQRSTYIGLTNTLMAPVSLLAPLLAGGMAQWLGYPLMLVALVLLIAYSIFMLWAKVQDPRHLLTS